MTLDKSRLIQAYAVLVAAWLVHLSNTRYILGSEGVQPGMPTEIWRDIIALTLIHAPGNGHIMSNTFLLVPCLFALALIDKMPALTVAVIAGLGAWLLWYIGDPDGTIHQGASILGFGLVAYLVVYGLRQRSMVSIIVAGGVALAFGMETLMSALPGDPSISWQGHAAGIIVGVAWGLVRPR